MKSLSPVPLFVLFFICFISCSFITGNHELPDYSPTGVISELKTADWDSITFDTRYRVVNNVWNKQASTGSYNQSVFTEDIDGTDGFGWQWNWINQSNMVVAYPEVIYGDKPWDSLSGISTAFPVKAGSADITADFDILINAAGIYNMAFSIWCVSSIPQEIGNITHEIMIWTSNSGMIPAGTKYSTIAIQGTEYDVYVKQNHTDDSGGSSHNWTYVAFMAKGKITEGPFIISDFTDYLLGKGVLADSNYITSVELGNEIIYGSGCVEIRNYSISVVPK